MVGCVGVIGGGGGGDDVAVGHEEEFGFPFQAAEEAGAEGEVVEAVGIRGSGRCGGSACNGGVGGGGGVIIRSATGGGGWS